MVLIQVFIQCIFGSLLGIYLWQGGVSLSALASKQQLVQPRLQEGFQLHEDRKLERNKFSAHGVFPN